MIAIINYGLNDTTYLTQMLSSLKIDFKITRDEREILDCDKVIISDSPSLSKAVKKIHLFNLFSILRMQNKPILGISLGLELLCNKNEVGLACLGLIPVDSKERDINEYSSNQNINWKIVHQIKQSPLFYNIPNDTKFYFDSPYYVEVVESTVATSSIDKEYSAAIIKDNFYGVQFIPEKSGEYGSQLLKNFVTIC